MWTSKRVLFVSIATVIGVMSLALAAGAFGDEGHHHGHRATSREPGRHRGGPVIDESLAPSMPTDPSFHGVRPGTAPWVLRSGKVRLKRDGKLDLVVKGLVIPPPTGNGTPGPVIGISAALYCGSDMNHTAAATTPPVPLSSKGDARIHDASFAIPAECLAPVILVNPELSTGVAPRYIAVDGWRAS